MDKRIAKKFFGTDLDNSFERVILMNIKPFFDVVSDLGNVILENKGFYENKKIIINDSIFRVILITPGNVIVDVLKVIGEISREITIFGLIGGLSEGVKRGDIVKPKVSLSANNRIFELDSSGQGMIFQTDGLVHDKNFYEDLKNRGVDFVDMESVYLGSFGKDKSISCRLIGLISDMPLRSPFYLDDVGTFDIKDKIIKMIKLI